MPNPAISQTEADRLFDRVLHALRKAEAVRELKERFESSDAKVIEWGDVNDNTTTWDLSGVELGVNTDAAGRIFVRVTGAGPFTVKGYKATGGGGSDEMFTGSGAADATVTLTAANSSGISGSVVLGSSPTADTSDNHKLRVLPGFDEHDRHVFDGAEDEDGKLRSAHQTFNESVVNSLQSLEDQAVALLESELAQDFISRVIKAASEDTLSKVINVDDDVVTLSVTGVVEDLREAMEDNTTEQKVAVTTLAAGSVTYDSGNSGAGTLTIGAVNPNLVPGTVTVKCSNESIPERFTVSFRPDQAFADKITGQQDLVVGKGWIDPDLNISLTLNRTYDKNSTDGSNLEVAAVADITGVTGLSLDESDDGVLYGKIVANGSNWDVEFYKASGRTTADLVAKATNVATGAVFTATQQNRSGLSIGWKVGSGPTNGNTFELDTNPFKVGPPADVMTFAITRSAKGEIQDAWREHMGWYLHQGASPTIPDTLLQRGGRAIVEL